MLETVLGIPVLFPIPVLLRSEQTDTQPRCPMKKPLCLNWLAKKQNTKIRALFRFVQPLVMPW